MRLAIIGEARCGKSTLAHSFKNYVVKRGLSCAIANLDPFCRHIRYEAGFDCRKGYPSKGVGVADCDDYLEEAYLALSRDEELSRWLMLRSSSILDCRGGAGFFLSTRGCELLRKRADTIIFCADGSRPDCDFTMQADLALMLSKKTAVPTLLAINKWDAVKPSRQQTLFDSFEPTLPPGSIATSGIEGIGFAELFFAGISNKRRQAREYAALPPASAISTL